MWHKQKSSSVSLKYLAGISCKISTSQLHRLFLSASNANIICVFFIILRFDVIFPRKIVKSSLRKKMAYSRETKRMGGIEDNWGGILRDCCNKKTKCVTRTLQIAITWDFSLRTAKNEMSLSGNITASALDIINFCKKKKFGS